MRLKFIPSNFNPLRWAKKKIKTYCWDIGKEDIHFCLVGNHRGSHSLTGSSCPGEDIAKGLQFHKKALLKKREIIESENF